MKNDTESQNDLTYIKNQHDLLLFIQKNITVCNFDQGIDRDIEKLANDAERNGFISISGHKDGDDYWTLTKKGRQFLLGVTSTELPNPESFYSNLRKIFKL